jgi:cyclopropane fatty-acyl-phospholipid synthase-like methyltransferase
METVGIDLNCRGLRDDAAPLTPADKTVAPTFPSGNLEPDLHPDVKASYDGSKVLFRLLRLGTWGPVLMNLGSYRFRGPLAWIHLAGNLELAQQRLVFQTADRLDLQPGQRILDVACGRGKSSFMLSCLQSESTIVGMDYLEPQVEVARTLFCENERLKYVAGSAMDLPFPAQSFDRIMCLEAAFHFPDRGQFLSEAARVLSPQGLLVVVDFTWRSEADRKHRNDPATKLVRKIWQWDDLFSLEDYHRAAHAAGLVLRKQLDWSHRVTAPVQRLLEWVSWLGNSRIGHRLLVRIKPLYQALSADDWKEVAEVVRAHAVVQRRTRYSVMVFERPALPGD